MKNVAFALGLALLASSCAEKPGGEVRAKGGLTDLDVTTSQEFARTHSDARAYWHSGLAELNRFELRQSRYGEIHEGEAVMIFVTEPFLPDKQVKQDFGRDPGALQVLKNNFYRRFYTGVYPYTILTSTFTPERTGGPTIKLTQSVQDWCGQVFAQLNLNPTGDGYRGQVFSYFQAEGDQQFDYAGTLIEDDLYTRVRLGPEKLPVGELELMPSATYLRLAHKPWKPLRATASLSEAGRSDFSKEPVRTYTLRYAEPARTMSIHFEAAFPYRIVGFEDTYDAIFNPDGGRPERLTTVGRLTNSIMLDYWAKHGTADAAWRDALGLQL